MKSKGFINWKPCWIHFNGSARIFFPFFSFCQNSLDFSFIHRDNKGKEVSTMRKGIIITLTVWFLVIVLAVLGFFTLRWYHRTYITVDGQVIRRDTTALDLSGAPVEQWERLTELIELTFLNLRGTGLTPKQHDTLQEALPNCQIQWDILFQGKYYPNDIKNLTLTSLKDEEVDLLDYLPHLTAVYATECPDLDQLLELQRRHPTCLVSYDVTIAGEVWDHDADYLVLPGISTGIIMDKLQYLPDVERILLTEPLPPMDEIQTLQKAFPDITVTYLVDIHGYTVSPDATVLELSDIAMPDLNAVERALNYLPEVERVIMCNCGISNEAMDAINNAHPDIRFVWTVDIGPFRLRTDATGFIPIKYGRWLNDEECYNLRYCEDMVALDLGHCEISNCDFVAFMPKLKYLILADTNIYDISPIANHTELVYLELFMTRVWDYTPLLSCTNLEDLNLCYTYGQIGVLTQMTHLKRLWWGPGREGQRIYLQQFLPNTYLELDSPSSTGKGWREGKHYYDQRDYLGMYYMYG